MEVKRAVKVADLIKREVSRIIVENVKDPRVGFVTITHVKMTEDLKEASIYFSVLGDPKQREDTIKGLNRATPFIRMELGSRIRLRYTPKIKFLLDTTLDYAENIEKIIKKLKDV